MDYPQFYSTPDFVAKFLNRDLHVYIWFKNNHIVRTHTLRFSKKNSTTDFVGHHFLHVGRKKDEQDTT